jgi:hypothetical protein
MTSLIKSVVTEDSYNTEVVNAPVRSPGLRLGGIGQRGSPIKEMSTSPISESGNYPSFPPVARSGSNSQVPQQGGVKRTKSLMQKFKTMVRTRSGSVESGYTNQTPVVRAGVGQRQPSYGAGQGYGGEDVLQEEIDDRVGGGEDQYEDAREDVFGAPGQLGGYAGVGSGRRRTVSAGNRQ